MLGMFEILFKLFFLIIEIEIYINFKIDICFEYYSIYLSYKYIKVSIEKKVKGLYKYN